MMLHTDTSRYIEIYPVTETEPKDGNNEQQHPNT